MRGTQCSLAQHYTDGLYIEVCPRLGLCISVAQYGTSDPLQAIQVVIVYIPSASSVSGGTADTWWLPPSQRHVVPRPLPAPQGTDIRLDSHQDIRSFNSLLLGFIHFYKYF